MGCGHGVLADLLTSRGADVTAVDRSATTTAATARRTAGRVRVLTGSLTDLELDATYDVVVSFDVRAFWTPPAPEWDVVARVLAPRGRVVVAFSVMADGQDGRVRDEVSRLAAPHGFTVVGEHSAGTAPYPSAAVVLGR